MERLPTAVPCCGTSVAAKLLRDKLVGEIF